MFLKQLNYEMCDTQSGVKADTTNIDLQLMQCARTGRKKREMHVVLDGYHLGTRATTATAYCFLMFLRS